MKITCISVMGRSLGGGVHSPREGCPACCLYLIYGYDIIRL
jgi:hypothetical protein